MIKKPIAGLLLLAGAAGGPYVLFETDAGKTARSALTQSSSSDNVPSGNLTSINSNGKTIAATPFWGESEVPTSSLNPSTVEHNLSQPPVASLREIVRFDIVPGWILNRFPRVSTVLADMQLDGLRTPVITGTQPQDVAGTLTYYFDRYKKLQRISLRGVTGDPSALISELTTNYGMQQEPSLGGGLYLLKWNGQAKSVLHIAPAPVIYGDAPYARYNVFLEVNQPGMAYGLSTEAKQLIYIGKQNQRW